MKNLVSTIRTDKLRKIYGHRQVVSDVSIQVSQGEIVGLLGPNGAGKTTTFYMIVALDYGSSKKRKIAEEGLGSWGCG